MKKQLPCISMQSKFMPMLLVMVMVITTLNVFAQDYRYTDSWGKQGLSIKRQSTDALNINFSMKNFSIEDRDVNGTKMKAISFSESLLPNEEGNPDLPGFSRYIAMPQGATPVVEIVSMRTERFTNIDIAPAPRIPLDTDDSPLRYVKNQQVYSRDAFYPANPIETGDFTKIRGVDVFMLGIHPYQYNPVTKELLVYRDMEISIRFEGGNKQFGESKYRSRYWDQILEDVIFNFSSLPVIDYDSRVADYGRSTGYEYLIITPNDPIFTQWGDSIKKFRNEEGIYTGMIKLSDIGTSVSASMLESYVNNAYNTWDIPPTAILLLGDYGNASANTNSIISPIYDNYCVSDNILADVTGNHMPDIVFARITAQNAAQLQSMISRFLKYERRPPVNPGFYANPITALGWQTVRWFQICSETVGGFWKNSLGKTPVRINDIYEGTPGSVWSTATNTSTVVNVFGPNGLGYIPQSPATLGGWTGGNATMINNSLNAGAFMLMHRDHGEEVGWGEPRYNNSNISGLTNTDLTWILSINCLTGKYNWSSECFTEKFHRHTYNGQPAGALGVTGASEVSYSFVNDTYVWGLIDNMWPNFMPDYGTNPASRGVLPAFANAAGKYFLQQSNWPYNTGNKAVTYHLFHHHGDAFTRVCANVPQNIMANYEPTITQGENTVTVTTVPNATICISSYGAILATAQTGISTTVNMTIPTQLIGTVLKVTITKQDHNRHEGYITVVAAAPSANAGVDATVCEGLEVQMAAQAANYQTLLWETSGTGTFNNPAILNPIYTPSTQDVQAGSVTLTLTASKAGSPTATDNVVITLVSAPTAFAGNSSAICEGSAFSLSEAVAANYTQLFWTTSGTGTFDDINALTPRYLPSEEDELNGNVVLTLSISNEFCEAQNSSLSLTINPKPVANITGSDAICQFEENVAYLAESEGNTYNWSIIGGNITSGENTNQINVTWLEAGEQSLSLLETNEFGCSDLAAKVVVVNETPVPVISGNTTVCANSTVVYTTPMVEGDIFEWVIIGGTINSGTSNEVSVNWEGNGEGNLQVVQTNEHSCSGTGAILVAISSPEYTLATDTTMCVNHNAVISVLPGFAQYAWSNGTTTNALQVSGSQIGAGNSQNFTVTVTDANGCSVEKSINIIVEACTGLEESALNNAFSLYPNPNTGEFNIVFNGTLTGKALIRIISSTGNVVYTDIIELKNNIQTNKLNVSNLNNGIYFIKVETQHGSTVKRLVINK